MTDPRAIPQPPADGRIGPEQSLFLPRTLPSGLDPAAAVLPGVSLVTASRNRTGNLLAALPSWLAEPGIDQIVIVDWSSDMPVTDSLAAAGIGDPRIEVARVEGEAAWVLTWAFNLGLRLARHARVLKVDADIRLAPGFLAANPLARAQVRTGNWRTAAPGQEYVNGVFFAHRADLAAVQGFNEHLTGYGWDDDDLYDRLARTGTRRTDLAPGSVHHLDHDDAARLPRPAAAHATGWSDLAALPMHGIRTNRLLATLMPDWTPARRMQPFAQAPDGTWGRTGPAPHPVPEVMRRTARRLAGREMLSWQAGAGAMALEDDSLDLLLTARRLADTTALHVALMRAGAPLDVVAAPRHLVGDLDAAALQARPEAALGLKQSLISAAAATGRALALRGHDAPPPPFDDLPHLPADTPLGAAPEVAPETAGAHAMAPVARLTAGLALLRRMPPGPPALARPGTPRLFIDAQHGLGNRLRAIGSAAAVARATGRELVVVWQPDHHCEGHLRELFDYAGAVIDESFPAEAAAAARFTCMELEEGAARDAAFDLPREGCVYIRSAYVLNHPASHWGADAAFLRALQPGPEVMALVRAHTAAHPRPEIALHIRTEGAPGQPLKSHDAPGNWSAGSHAAMQAARAQSDPARFIARTGALLAQAPGATAFVAADSPAAYAALADAFGPRIARLERTLYDRSAAQLRHALADALLLARARHFLASPWSSFSELALRLSTTIARHETAGRDF